MIVRDLIAALATRDQDAVCVVSGYEGGETEVVSTSIVRVAVGCNESKWYYGEYDTDPMDGSEHQWVDVVKICGLRHCAST